MTCPSFGPNGAGTAPRVATGGAWIRNRFVVDPSLDVSSENLEGGKKSQECCKHAPKAFPNHGGHDTTVCEP